MAGENEQIQRLTDEIAEAMYRCKEGDIPKVAAEIIIERCKREIQRIEEDELNAAKTV